MKKVMLVIALSMAALLAWAQNENRGLLFQLGLGASFPSYPSDLGTVLDEVAALPGVTRVQIDLDVELGIPIVQQSYLMLGVNGCGDRLQDSAGDWMQLNMYLYSVGIRYYVEVSGLYGEVDIGGSNAVLDSSVGSTISNTTQFSWGGVIGYDFFPRHRGLSLALEGRYNAYNIDGTLVPTFAAVLDLLYK